MNETTKQAKGGKYGAPATKQEEKRAKATHHLIVRLSTCLAIVAGIYTARATGDVSGRLALLLSSTVLTTGAFFTGVWAQYMWPKEG